MATVTAQKARVQRLDRRLTGVEAELEVQFSPTELALSKGVQLAEVPIPGLDAPILQFVRGQTETLALDLFFDTTETNTAVTERTDAFYALVKIDPESHAPPVCRFIWGKAAFAGAHFSGRIASQQRRNGFQCVVESVRQRFTLFSSDGTPLRAVLTVSLREYKTLAQQLTEIRFRSPEHTRTHVVQRGETLSAIAADAYDDPGEWRPIAERNRIVDPLALSPGTVLQLPALR
jgi:nucleoid-associated protein YgaU